MDNFLRYFYQDIGRVIRAFFEIIGALPFRHFDIQPHTSLSCVFHRIV